MATARGLDLAAQLAAICGDEHVQRLPDVRVQGMQPAFAVAPGTAEAVARVLHAAGQSGAAVTPWGGGTQQAFGAVPARLDIVLHTRRLDDLLDWEPADLTASAQAGLTLARAQALLRVQGQQIPIEAPRAERATLGGLIATATAGPRRRQYGGWRDLIIGMEVALSDGSVIKSGGRVVKNVQGYDLGKLFTGSLGTLGVICRVNLKLAPLPAARRLLVARGELRTVADFLAGVAASTARVAAIDLLGAAAADACGLGKDDAAGLVLIEGQTTVVGAQSETLARSACERGARVEAMESAGLEPVWQAWLDLAATDNLAPGEALLALSARPSDTCDAIEAIQTAAGVSGCTCRAWARAGDGLVYARLRAGMVTALEGMQAALLPRWPATALTLSEAASERAGLPWGKEPQGMALMRALKQRFDAAGTLQRGRFIGGI